MYCDYDDDNDFDTDDEPEYDDDSDTSNDLGSDDNVLFDSKDDTSDDSAADEDIDRYSYMDSGYSSDGTDITIIEDIDKCYTTELDMYR